MKTVLVVGRDWKFRALLRAQLREEGFEALGFEGLAEAAAEIASSAPPPAALIFDTGEAPPAELAQLPALAEKFLLLVVASAGELLTIPETHILRRPVQLHQLVAALASRVR